MAIGVETELARRIAHERKRLGLSYQGLAIQMRRHGAPTDASALYRIEKGDPPRRITVNELVALARTFDLSVEELLRPVSAVLYAEIERLIINQQEALDAFFTAIDDLRRASQEVAVAFAKATDAGDDEMREALDNVKKDLDVANTFIVQDLPDRATLEAVVQLLDVLMPPTVGAAHEAGDT